MIYTNKMLRIHFKKNSAGLMKPAAAIIVLIIIYALLYKVLIPKILSFGCFDDCFNYAAGNFILKGRTLYSEIFFNHQPLPAYISAFIQYFSRPINVFDLILKHRQFLLFFSFLFNALFIFRFGKIMFLFTLLYEPAKYYVFGDRFLAESFTVYPLVFITLTVMEAIRTKKTTAAEAITMGFLTWFIFWMREPLAPAALLILIIYTFINTDKNKRWLTAAVFLVLTSLLFLFFPVKDWYRNVVTDNLATQLPYEANQKNLAGPGMILPFIYPLTALATDPFRHPYTATASLVSLAFIISLLSLNRPKSRTGKSAALFIIVMAGLTNLRYQPSTVIYYQAFHMINWFGLVTAFSVYSLGKIESPKIKTVLLVLLLLSIGVNIFSPKSHVREKPDRQAALLTHYGDLMKYGSIVRTLSSPGDTLFIDGAEELIYWEAKLDSPYRYGMYTSVMPKFDKYRNARNRMFSENPPDFYVGSCPKINRALANLSPVQMLTYLNLTENDNNTCLYVHKDKIATIMPEKMTALSDLNYIFKN